MSKLETMRNAYAFAFDTLSQTPVDHPAKREVVRAFMVVANAYRRELRKVQK